MNQSYTSFEYNPTWNHIYQQVEMLICFNSFYYTSSGHLRVCNSDLPSTCSLWLLLALASVTNVDLWNYLSFLHNCSNSVCGRSIPLIELFELLQLARLDSAFAIGKLASRGSRAPLRGVPADSAPAARAGPPPAGRERAPPRPRGGSRQPFPMFILTSN